MWNLNCCYMLCLIYVRFGCCSGVSNEDFNASLRDYAVKEDTNSSNVNTLQKEYKRYASVIAARTPIRFKAVPDSALAPSSSHSRGLLQQGYNGYGLGDYEEGPHFGYAYEYHIPEDHGHEELHHYPQDHHLYQHDYKHSHGYHHKHIDHALAAKKVLWPIAGLALLGAAAALVSNPIVLQLGVVSGKRRRRDTDNEDLDKLPYFTNKGQLQSNEGSEVSKVSKPVHIQNENKDILSKLVAKRSGNVLKKIRPKLNNDRNVNGNIDNKQYISIPLKYKEIINVN